MIVLDLTYTTSGGRVVSTRWELFTDKIHLRLYGGKIYGSFIPTPHEPRYIGFVVTDIPDPYRYSNHYYI